LVVELVVLVQSAREVVELAVVGGSVVELVAAGGSWWFRSSWLMTW
jgi:hypothetical protein